jgi:hypothetical protein
MKDVRFKREIKKAIASHFDSLVIDGEPPERLTALHDLGSILRRYRKEGGVLVAVHPHHGRV